MALITAHYFCQCRIRQGVTHSPAGHSICFAHAVDDNSSLLCVFRDRCNRNDLFLIRQYIIDLIRYDDQIIFLCQFGDIRQYFFRVHITTRVGGIIDDNGSCIGGNCCFQRLNVRLEIILFLCFYDHGDTVCHLYQFRIGDPIGRNDQYLIARIQNRLKYVEQRLLCTIGYDNTCRFVFQPVYLLITLCNGLAQIHNTGHGSIFGAASVDGCLCSFFYIIRGIKVRLAYTKTDNIHTLRFHFFRQGIDTKSERRGNAHSLF